MKKIVVMSDSHHNDEFIEDIYRKEQGADAYLHCGDICSDERQFPWLEVVQGNCDYNWDLPRVRVLQYEGVGIYMTHGDKIVDRNNTLARRAKERGCSIVIHGHTHSYVDETVDGVRILNPGALSMNRDGNPRGYIVITVDGSDYTVERKVL